MDARGRRSLATALAAPELTPALSPVYDVATSKTQRPSKPLRMRSPVNGHEAVYEWHQKRAHELVAGLGVVMDGHAWQFGEPVEAGPSYHARVASIIAQVSLSPRPSPSPSPIPSPSPSPRPSPSPSPSLLPHRAARRVSAGALGAAMARRPRARSTAAGNPNPNPKPKPSPNLKPKAKSKPNPNPKEKRNKTLSPPTATPNSTPNPNANANPDPKAHPALARGHEVVELGTGLGTAAVCAPLLSLLTRQP